MSVGSKRRPKKRHHDRNDVKQLNVTIDASLVDRVAAAADLLGINQWEIVEPVLRSALPAFEARIPADVLDPPDLFTNQQDGDDSKGRSAASDAA